MMTGEERPLYSAKWDFVWDQKERWFWSYLTISLIPMQGVHVEGAKEEFTLSFWLFPQQFYEVFRKIQNNENEIEIGDNACLAKISFEVQRRNTVIQYTSGEVRLEIGSVDGRQLKKSLIETAEKNQQVLSIMKEIRRNEKKELR